MIELRSDIGVVTDDGRDPREAAGVSGVTGGPAADDDGLLLRVEHRSKRIKIGCDGLIQHRKAGHLADGLSALAGRLHSYRTGVDDAEVGVLRAIDLPQAAAAQEGGDLLGFILVDLATKGGKAERPHGGKILAEMSGS